MELWQEAEKAFHLSCSSFSVTEMNSVAATVPPPLTEEEVEEGEVCDLSPDKTERDNACCKGQCSSCSPPNPRQD